MKKKIRSLIAIVLFACLLILPIATFNLKPNTISEAENRYLASFPEIVTENGSLSPNLLGNLQDWFSDNIGLRDQMVSFSSLIKYDLLRISPSTKVEIGKDNWFYYTLNGNIDIAKQTYELFGENELKTIANQQQIIKDNLAKQGIEYMLLLPTSKVSIYPEYIQSGDYSVCTTPADILADYLENNTEVKVVRLKDALLKAKDENVGQLYFRTDTHWNELGAYIGYKKIIECMNSWGIINSAPAEVSFEEGTFMGEFSAMMGRKGLLGAEACPKSTIINQKAVNISNTEEFAQTKSLFDQAGTQVPACMYSNENSDGPNVLMFGDSMFGSWNATELLAENSSRFTYVWDYNITQSAIDIVKPDVVIYDMAERFLNTLSQKSVSFVQTPLQGSNAAVTNISAEFDYRSGKPIDIEVTVRNIGSQTWNALDGIRLCMLLNDIDVGTRAYIGGNEDVAPGEEYTFKLSDITVTDPNASVKFTMLQEGVQYFGEIAVLGYDGGKKAEALNAELISEKLPSEVIEGSPFDFSVTVKNSGTDSWTSKDDVCLGLFTDGADNGIRAKLPDNIEVLPGNEYTFKFLNVTLPADSKAEIQMLKENVGYFGEKKQISIDVKPNENEVSEAEEIDEMNDLDAQILDVSFSDDGQGQTKYFVNVRNSGTSAWSEDEEIRIAVFSNGVDSGLRGYIPKDIVIESSAEYTFEIDSVYASNNEEITFQMLREYVCYFGERK